MRVISADALIMKQVSDGVYIVDAEAILNAPSFDAEPVVHSEWEITEVDHAYGQKCYHCPECGTDEWRYNATRYCPNCGAKMN